MRKMFLTFFILLLTITLFACSEPTTETDVVPPNIMGATDITYTIGQPTPEYLLNVTAFDSVDGDLTASITVDDSGVDLTEPGIYDLFYTVVDASLNSASVRVTVIVLSSNQQTDFEAPTFLAPASLSYQIGDPVPNYLEGIYAYDTKDGSLTSRIIVDDSAVDLTTAGTYEIYYSVTDNAGNEATLTLEIEVTDPNETNTLSYLDIYYINDTHGAILPGSNQMGMAAIGNLIRYQLDDQPDNTLFLAGGDILQGSLISNHFRGASMIDVLNDLRLDAFVLGNHEFDWGLETITTYFDPETEELKAAYPLLAANVFFEGTIIRPDHIDAYTIIEKKDVKIGIIGLMGYGLEYSIAPAMVDAYEFQDPVFWADHYASYLREEASVDIVIAVVHGSSETTNQALGNLSGTSRIDATFNGHSHSAYTRAHGRDGVDMPIMQAGANGSHVGHVRLLIEAKEVTGYQASLKTASNDARLGSPDLSVQTIIDSYYDQVSDLINQPIIVSGAYYSRNDLTFYMADLIRTTVDADIGIHNFGGTRASLSLGQNITVATLYEIFPFDNKIKTVDLLGSVIKAYIIDDSGSVAATYRSGLSLETIEDDVYYKVATNEYVFDQTDNPFIYGDNILDTYIIIRDVLEDVLRTQSETYEYFYTTNPIIVTTSTLDPTIFMLGHDPRHPFIQP